MQCCGFEFGRNIFHGLLLLHDTAFFGSMLTLQQYWHVQDMWTMGL